MMILQDKPGIIADPNDATHYMNSTGAPWTTASRGIMRNDNALSNPRMDRCNESLSDLVRDSLVTNGVDGVVRCAQRDYASTRLSVTKLQHETKLEPRLTTCITLRTTTEHRQCQHKTNLSGNLRIIADPNDAFHYMNSTGVSLATASRVITRNDKALSNQRMGRCKESLSELVPAPLATNDVDGEVLSQHREYASTRPSVQQPRYETKLARRLKTMGITSRIITEQPWYQDNTNLLDNPGIIVDSNDATPYMNRKEASMATVSQVISRNDNALSNQRVDRCNESSSDVAPAQLVPNEVDDVVLRSQREYASTRLSVKQPWHETKLARSLLTTLITSRTTTDQQRHQENTNLLHQSSGQFDDTTGVGRTDRYAKEFRALKILDAANDNGHTKAGVARSSEECKHSSHGVEDTFLPTAVPLANERRNHPIGESKRNRSSLSKSIPISILQEPKNITSENNI